MLAGMMSTNRAKEGGDLRSIHMETTEFRNPLSAFYNQKTPPPLPESGAFFAAELQTSLQAPIYPSRKSEQA